MHLLNESLRAVRHTKSYYRKKLDETKNDKEKENINRVIDKLSEEEEFLLKKIKD